MAWIKQVTKCPCRKPVNISRRDYDTGSIWQCDNCKKMYKIKQWESDYRESWPVWELYTEPF